MNPDASREPSMLGSIPQSTSNRPSTTPSCQLCRKRKVKCDRANPCLPCQRAGVECVYSVPARLPRGRQGGRRKKDSELLHRIAKLENLVKDLEGGDDAKKGPSPGSQQTESEVSPEILHSQPVAFMTCSQFLISCSKPLLAETHFLIMFSCHSILFAYHTYQHFVVVHSNIGLSLCFCTVTDFTGPCRFAGSDLETRWRCSILDCHFR